MEIKLYNSGTVIETNLIVNVEDTEQEWKVRWIELWTAGAAPQLLADDIRFESLSPATQEAIIEELNESQRKERHAKYASAVADQIVGTLESIYGRRVGDAFRQQFTGKIGS